MNRIQKGQLDITCRDEELIRKARELIAADVTKHYTIPALARAMHLNECKLKAGFKKIYGTGIWTYLSRLRLEKAQAMMKDTDLSVKEVAYAVGCRYVANFITCYKRAYHRTPGDDRQNGKVPAPPEFKTNAPEFKDNGFAERKNVTEF